MPSTITPSEPNLALCTDNPNMDMESIPLANQIWPDSNVSTNTLTINQENQTTALELTDVWLSPTATNMEIDQQPSDNSVILPETNNDHSEYDSDSTSSEASYEPNRSTRHIPKWNHRNPTSSRKTYNRLLKTYGSADNSIHACESTSVQHSQTFDAYIADNKVPGQHTNDKIACMSLHMLHHTHYVTTDSYKRNGQTFIRIKFSSLDGLRRATRIHNQHHPGTTLSLKKYYSVNGTKMSSNVFKLIQVPDQIKDRQILSSLRNYAIKGNFTITQRTEYGDIYFSVNDEDSIHILKQLWSITIGNNLNIRLAPAYFTEQHFTERNRWVAKFRNFKDNASPADAMAALYLVNAMNAYPNTAEQSVFFVEFASESDLHKACHANIEVGNQYLQGLPRGTAWSDYNTYRKNIPTTVTAKPIKEPTTETPPLSPPTEKCDSSTPSTTVKPINEPPTPKCPPGKYLKSRKGKAPVRRPNTHAAATGSNKIPLGPCNELAIPDAGFQRRIDSGNLTFEEMTDLLTHESSINNKNWTSDYSPGSSSQV